MSTIYKVEENKIVKIEEAFSKKEEEEVLKAVKKCFSEKGNDGVRKYDVLNRYLGRLSFEVDATEIKVGDWKSNSYNRQIKSAEVHLQGKFIGFLEAHTFVK